MTSPTSREAIQAASDPIDELLDVVQIHTDADGRHWDTDGREYTAVDIDGELTYTEVTR